MIEIQVLDGIAGLPFAKFTFPKYRAMLLAANAAGPVTAIGATRDGAAVGLVLGTDLAAAPTSTVVSLYVDPAARGQRLGQALLARLEEVLRARGVAQMVIAYHEGRPGTPATHALLAALQWPAAVPERLLCKCDRRMLEADWMRARVPLPADYEIFPWGELTGEDRERFAAAQARDPWVTPDVDPLIFGKDVEFNSVGLRYRGDLVGWVLTERFDAQTLFYSCSYLRPDMQRMGRILPLYVEAVSRHAQRLDIPNALWVVPYKHPAMVRFVRRKMAPYATLIQDYVVSTKAL
jgi:GNAT superfamily N-acetyltransferase